MSTNAKELLGGFIKQAEDEATLQTQLESEWKEYESKKSDTLFDVINRMFKDSDDKWDELTDYEKAKHSFMINQTFAIQYPVSANNMNALKANPLGIVETWRRVAKAWKRTPQWIYTKRGGENPDPLKKFSDETIRAYMSEHWCGRRDMLEMYKLNGDEFLEELKYIEDFIVGEKSTMGKKKEINQKKAKGKKNGNK